MCTVCGCDGATVKHDHSHDHSHSHSHDHGHHHHHDGQSLDYGSGKAGVHVAGQSQERLVQIERDILGTNNDFAHKNRDHLSALGVTAINLLSSPGSGKTTLLTETLKRLSARGADAPSLAVIEGDQQTSNDADRIRETGVDAIQINTGKGCHLDADMVGHAIAHLPLKPGGLLFIENVGNLVCPASFDLGEGARVVLASVTEGEDKPVKYPDMFATADIVLMTKSDLLPYLDFDVSAFEASVRTVNERAAIVAISSTRSAKGQDDDGFDQWLAWLDAQHHERMAAAE